MPMPPPVRLTLTFLLLATLGGPPAAALAADLGPRHHAQGSYDDLTAIYVVVEGDDLSAIAARFALPLEQLKARNRLGDDQLAVGQRLVVETAPPPVEPVLEPQALAVLKAMGERLAGARALRFTALSTYEQPSRIGPALAYTTRSEVLLQRPDKLRVITLGDGPATEFYYDGKTVTAYAPAEDLVALAKAPGDLDATLQAAFEQAAIYYPFTDFIVADPYRDLTDGLLHAFYIGQSKVVGGTTTDMVALANQDVFVQLWVGADDHLPRQMRAVYRSDPRWLRNVTELSDWQVDPSVPADAFGSAKAAAARQIPFVHPAALATGAGAAPASPASQSK